MVVSRYHPIPRFAHPIPIPILSHTVRVRALFTSQFFFFTKTGWVYVNIHEKEKLPRRKTSMCNGLKVFEKRSEELSNTESSK